MQPLELKTKGTLKRQIQSLHEGKKCTNCDTTFAKMIGFNSYMVSNHEGKGAFQCNICDAIFARKGNLKRHVLSGHEGKKNFRCNTCTATFSQKYG